MKQNSAGKISMKKAFLIPMAAAMGITMAAPAFAGQIYVGDTETVVSYDENENKVITMIFDPAKTPDFFREQYITPPKPVKAAEGNRRQAEPLTEAPEVGAVLANIRQEDENGEMQFTKPYHWCAVGQCTWYANGRFCEVTGIRLPLLGNAKEWLGNAWHSDDVQTVTDLSDVPEQAVAVYVPRADDTLPGHVCFVEYVERDADENPLYIYYTDANGKADKEKNAYTPGYDGAVIKEDFETFKGSKDLELAGYIIAK